MAYYNTNRETGDKLKASWNQENKQKKLIYHILLCSASNKRYFKREV